MILTFLSILYVHFNLTPTINYDYSKNIIQQHLNKAYNDFIKNKSYESIEVLSELYNFNENFDRLEDIASFKNLKYNRKLKKALM